MHIYFKPTLIISRVTMVEEKGSKNKILSHVSAIILFFSTQIRVSMKVGYKNNHNEFYGLMQQVYPEGPLTFERDPGAHQKKLPHK